MRLSTLFSAAVLSIALPLFALADGHHVGRRHTSVARRARGDVSQFEKRSFDNARFTYYAVGLGACGITNVPSDFIVALNSDQFGPGYPGAYCFKSITIQVGSITAVATITDECPGCPYAGLDMSSGLFQHFAPLSVGVLYGSWWFNDGSGSGDNSNPSPSPSPSPPPPTTTHTTPKDTPTPTPTSTSTSTSSSTTSHTSTSSSKSSSSHSSSSSSSSSSSPSSTPTPGTSGSLLGVNEAFLGLGGVIVNAANAAN